MPAEPDCPFVSRGGLKLHHALSEFHIDPTGMRCADLGCSTGGFTDCLLQAGAARVFALDTAYGQLAWKLRTDDRVTLLERSNALHTDPPGQAGRGVDLVVIDLGWTRQSLAIPAALRWLAPAGRIITLIKPHYEQPAQSSRAHGRLPPLGEPDAARIAHEVAESLPALGVRVLGLTKSPILGRKGGRGEGHGNVEYLALLERDH
jgi:23S rRNA (cytidine1920-2'-O)/16S rRNA (cytidine1409-2'-O)-methyltransferase